MIAAIDAGSNAVRLLIARVIPPFQVVKLESRRLPVRLGHQVFVDRRFDDETILAAIEAFKYFKSLMVRYRVEAYRAVATSACRESENSAVLIESIRKDAGISLEIISAREEARLINQAVRDAVGEKLAPEMIMDLGGGSLELSLVEQGGVEESWTLPVGTVRLMETLGIRGALSEKDLKRIRLYVQQCLDANFPRRPSLLGFGAAACGGNAEALARLAPGSPLHDVPTIDIYSLEEILWRILRMNIKERMKAFGIGKDRAEVIGIAAAIITTLGRWLRLHEWIVPGVGVREGVLHDLISGLFPPLELDRKNRNQAIVNEARRTAVRFGCEAGHADQVRDLAISMYDQLPLGERPNRDSRLLLEVAALLHDVGHILGRRKHHKHGEYLVGRLTLPGLSKEQQVIIACLVRYHTKKMPRPSHSLYGSLDSDAQSRVRRLASLLRIAERLDSDHQQNIQGVKVSLEEDQASFIVSGALPSVHSVKEAREKTDLFEKEFGKQVVLVSESE